MSQENVGIVRRIYDEGLIDRDPESWLLELATSDIEYVNPPYAVEPGTRRGPVEVVRAMRGFAEVWEDSRHELHELFDCGDVVVAAVSWYTPAEEAKASLCRKRPIAGASERAESPGSSGVRISERPSKPPACGSRRALLGDATANTPRRSRGRRR
jgi:ketosteroid isomerase-like protein